MRFSIDCLRTLFRTSLFLLSHLSALVLQLSTIYCLLRTQGTSSHPLSIVQRTRKPHRFPLEFASMRGIRCPRS